MQTVHYGISITDNASPFLRNVMSSIDRGHPAKTMAESARTMMVKYFGDENQKFSRHITAIKLGAKPSQLFAQFARATHSTVSGNEITLSVSHVAAAHRYRGGVIKPKKGRGFLAFPVHGAAYGKLAREFGRVFSMQYLTSEQAPDGHEGRYLVLEQAITKEVGRVLKDGSRRKKIINPAGVYYRLVRSVTQHGDVTVLPNDRQFFEALETGFNEWLTAKRQTAG